MSRTSSPRVPPRVSLTLAGHTHGGQVRIPLHMAAARAVALMARGSPMGTSSNRDRHMIVSGGLGTSFAPVRLGVPPEIVHVEIGSRLPVTQMVRRSPANRLHDDESHGQFQAAIRQLGCEIANGSIRPHVR